MDGDVDEAYRASQQRAALFNAERSVEHAQVGKMASIKPDGYDLREKRADKANDAKQWTPQDAIYSTAERISDQDVSQLVVYWWERKPDGSEVMHWTNATSSLAEHALLLQKALTALMAPKG